MCDCNSTFDTLLHRDTTTDTHIHTQSFCPCQDECLNYRRFISTYACMLLLNIGRVTNSACYMRCVCITVSMRWHFSDEEILYEIELHHPCMCECVLSTKNNGSKSISFRFCCCSNIWISIKMYVLINIYKQPVRRRWSGRTASGRMAQKQWVQRTLNRVHIERRWNGTKLVQEIDWQNPIKLPMFFHMGSALTYANQFNWKCRRCNNKAGLEWWKRWENCTHVWRRHTSHTHNH